MTTFEDVLYKAKSLAESAGKKTGELVDQMRLKMDVAQAEQKLAATFEDLGRLVYDAHRSGEDIAPLIEEYAARIEELTEKIASIRRQLDEYRNVARCSDCDTANDEDAVYCRQCGTKLEK